MARDELVIREEDSDEDHKEGDYEADDDERVEHNSPTTSQNGTKKQKTVSFKVEKRIRVRPQKTRKDETVKRKMRLAQITAGLVKPDAATNREKERTLRRLATRGVVQLFNAVAERQCSMSDEVIEKLKDRQKGMGTRKDAKKEPKKEKREDQGDEFEQALQKDIQDIDNLE